MKGLVLGLVLLVGLVGCGGGDGDVVPVAHVLNEDGEVVSPGGTVVFHVNPTSTVYPTFSPVPATVTPEPSPTPTPYFFKAHSAGELRPPLVLEVSNEAVVEEEVPVVTLVPEAVVAVTEVPLVTPTVAAEVVAEPVEEPTPYPTPYGQLGAGAEVPVRFLYQSVFPLQGRNIPERHLTGEVSDLPAPARFISTTAKYVGWVAAFDTLSVPDGWIFEGVVRWVNLNSVSRPFMMYESPVSMEKGTFILVKVLGHDVNYVWYPGWYRVTLLNSDFEEVIGWDFEVR